MVTPMLLTTMALIDRVEQDSSAPTLTRVDGSNQSAVKALAGRFDVVVDATGSPHGLASASEICRPMGWVVAMLF